MELATTLELASDVNHEEAGYVHTKGVNYVILTRLHLAGFKFRQLANCNYSYCSYFTVNELDL